MEVKITIDNEGNIDLRKAKTNFNTAMAAAREALTEAIALRAVIEKIDPQYRGRSRRDLKVARVALHNARTFSGVPNDLDESDNEYRDHSVDYSDIE